MVRPNRPRCSAAIPDELLQVLVNDIGDRLAEIRNEQVKLRADVNLLLARLSDPPVTDPPEERWVQFRDRIDAVLEQIPETDQDEQVRLLGEVQALLHQFP